jgi:hypothetical protein
LKAQPMHKLRSCEATGDYRLRLVFEDGLEGSVFLGDLLEIGAFGAWRNVDHFRRAELDFGGTAVVWTGGIRLDADILWQDLASIRRRAVSRTGLARAVE